MLSIVVAVSENNVIGHANDLPWKLSGDLKRVKALTMGHHLIMGRKTYESIGRPLPGRTTVIVTRQKRYAPEGCIVVNTFFDAIKVSWNDNEAFVFGGGEIFKVALPHCDKIYLTRIHTTIEGTVFFPELNMDEWEIMAEDKYPADEKNEFACTVFEMQRIKV
ncbi:MAG: dihydrofolate reductase [Bacteroidetes bacterium]|nr:dihydrofolate reductase [Bacteroidota bacterium]